MVTRNIVGIRKVTRKVGDPGRSILKDPFSSRVREIRLFPIRAVGAAAEVQGAPKNAVLPTRAPTNDRRFHGGEFIPNYSPYILDRIASVSTCPIHQFQVAEEF